MIIKNIFEFYKNTLVITPWRQRRLLPMKAEGILWRADRRPPDELFKLAQESRTIFETKINGPWWPIENVTKGELHDYTKEIISGPYISFSREIYSAWEYGRKRLGEPGKDFFLYRISINQDDINGTNGFDVNKSLGIFSPYYEENEFAVYDRLGTVTVTHETDNHRMMLDEWFEQQKE